MYVSLVIREHDEFLKKNKELNNTKTERIIYD